MWTQQDSLEAPLDPVNANRYAYAGSDPINNYDPTGLKAWETKSEICAGICEAMGPTCDTGSEGLSIEARVGVGKVWGSVTSG